MRRYLPPLAAFVLLGVACAGLKPAADQRNTRSAEGPQERDLGVRQQPVAGPRPEDLTREELAAMLRGKGGADVKKLLGSPPLWTEFGGNGKGPRGPESPEFEGRFEYTRLTLRGPDRGGTARYWVVIHFSSGVVQRVDFTPSDAKR